MSKKLETLDSEFKVHHYALVDGDEALSKEQEVLDEHDDDVANLASRIKLLITACSSSQESSSRRLASRRLTHLAKNLSSIRDEISPLSTDTDDICLLRQYQEQLQDFKKELGDIHKDLLSLDLDDGDETCKLQRQLDKEIFECSLSIRKLLLPTSHPSDPAAPPAEGVKLQKLDVPKFDGNIVNWRTFWEQFSVSIDSRPHLSDSEKLVYLRHSLKDGSAKGVIEGLSCSGKYYAEAIESLKKRYDRPRLVHQTHVQMILEAAPLKEGSGRELCRLHDCVQQHMRTLKAMDYEPSGPFITSVLELKLDTNTMFEWQKFSQDSTDVPHYVKLWSSSTSRFKHLNHLSLRTREHHVTRITQEEALWLANL